jgi:hypothetical protein
MQNLNFLIQEEKRFKESLLSKKSLENKLNAEKK